MQVRRVLFFSLAWFIALQQMGMAQAASSAVPGAIQPVLPAMGDSHDEMPLPKGHVSLLGGTVTRVDPIRDRMVVRAFGGRDVTVDFDVRTQVLRGASPASIREIRPGSRIYADTIAKDGRTFAKTLRIETSSVLGETRGQVLSYDNTRGLLQVRDLISSQPLTLHVSPRTAIESGDLAVSATDIVTGSLVEISFQGASNGPSSAEKIRILARPGSTFVFAGRIAVIDLRDSHLTLYQQPGDTAFEVGLNSLTGDEKLKLKQGSDVVVHAQFDGRSYQARSIEPGTPSEP